MTAAEAMVHGEIKEHVSPAFALKVKKARIDLDSAMASADIFINTGESEDIDGLKHSMKVAKDSATTTKKEYEKLVKKLGGGQESKEEPAATESK